MAEISAYAFRDNEMPATPDHPEAIYHKSDLDASVQAISANDNVRIGILPAGYGMLAAAIRTSASLGASTQVKMVISDLDDGNESDVTAATTAASAATAVQSNSPPAWAVEPTNADRRIKWKLTGGNLAGSPDVYSMFEIALAKGFLVK